jgi:A/G-specific adenine glycosylase
MVFEQSHLPSPLRLWEGSIMGKFLISLQALDTWFQRQKRILPWRNDPTFYRVWISEIMLQQTQVATVIPYFEKFMGRFPKVEDLAAASEQEVLLYWAGLGYYSRARNLHRAAQKIVEEGKGFPQDREGWLEIPGVGNYTAGAILSIAGGQPEAILDGNVERVLSRIRRVSRQKGDSVFKSRLWKVSSLFVRTAYRHQINPSVLNQSLMELGATLCTPKKPKCLLCPLAQICRARAEGDAESFPPRKKPKEWVKVQEQLHCLVDGKGKILLRKRNAGEWRAGLWDLLDEKPSEGSSRIESIGRLETRYVVTRHKVERLTHVWKSNRLSSSIWKASDSQWQGEVKWVSLKDPDVAVGSPLRRTLQKLLEEFPELDT